MFEEGRLFENGARGERTRVARRAAVSVAAVIEMDWRRRAFVRKRGARMSFGDVYIEKYSVGEKGPIVGKSIEGGRGDAVQWVSSRSVVLVEKCARACIRK